MSRQGYETRRAMIEAERDLGSQILIWPATNGQPYVCVPSKSIAQNMLAALGGGFTSVGTAAFFVRAELFIPAGQTTAPALPATQQLLVSPGGGTFRIVSVNSSPDGVLLFLDCVDANYKA